MGDGDRGGDGPNGPQIRSDVCQARLCALVRRRGNGGGRVRRGARGFGGDGEGLRGGGAGERRRRYGGRRGRRVLNQILSFSFSSQSTNAITLFICQYNSPLAPAIDKCPLASPLHCQISISNGLVRV